MVGKNKNQNKKKSRKPRRATDATTDNSLVVRGRNGPKIGGSGMNQIGSLQGRFGLPTRYPLPTNDVVPANFKFTLDVSNTGTSVCAVSLIYGSGTSAGAVLYMNQFCPGFNNMATLYSRFLIKRIKFGCTQTTSMTDGGFHIANYEATSSTSSLPPTSVADVSNTQHLAYGNVANPSSFVVHPTDYYNDWRASVGDGSTTSASQMGVTQVYIRNGLPATSLVALLTAELEVVFCGYRF
jgi:hypothetical protein